MPSRLESILFVVTVWILLSFFGSYVKGMDNLCDKRYPVDYILYNHLFCEITAEEE